MKTVIITLLVIGSAAAQVPLPGPIVGGGGGAGGGATIPSVTNLIAGDGAGNGADSGIAPSAAVTLTGVQNLSNKTLASPAVTTSGDLTNSALGTTPAGGYTLTNVTAAAVGAQQVSPPTVWTGQGWRTVANLSKSVAYRAYALPVQGTNVDPSGIWTLESQIAGGAWTSLAWFNSAGTTNSPSFAVNGATTVGLGSSGSGTLDFLQGAGYGSENVIGQLNNGGVFVVKNSGAYCWTAGSSLSGNPTCDTSLTRSAAATIQHGAADTAAPVAQTIRYQNVATGTISGTVGPNVTYKAPTGTGTGVGGDFIYQVARAGGASTNQNTYSTAFTISGTSGAPVLPSVAFASLPASATVGTMIYCTDCVSGTFDATAAGAGTGTPVTYQNGAWKVK